MTDKQKFYRLLSFVCEELPTSVINELVQSGYPLGAVALMQVRQGRVINLPALVAMVHKALPAYQIPVDLLPAPAAQPLFS
jgi:hypothetical protein